MRDEDRSCCRAAPPAGIYVPPIPRLRSVIVSSTGTVKTARSSDCDDWREGKKKIGTDSSLHGSRYQQSSLYSRFAYDEYFDEDSDHDGMHLLQRL